MKKLSQQEIKQRLIRLRNIERLHEQQRFKIWNLRDENRNLKKEMAVLKETVAQQSKTIDDLKLQMEELRTIIFGKKRNPKDKNRNNNPEPPAERIQRDSDSYKRSVPNENEITRIQRHTANTCSCGMKTTRKKIAVFYQEDIPIPVKKIVIKHEVEKAYCPNCKKWINAVPLPNSKVILGQNIQKYTCYLSVMCRLSFTQIQNILNDTYQIQISQGEISKILNRQAIHLSPLYEQLKEKIRGEPAIHLDETGWRLFSDPDASFSWVMSGAESQESVFLVGENRGKGNAEKLTGEHYGGTTVTDDYAAYRKLENHQLCWAHLIRKFRDLANSQELDEIQSDYCKKEYHKLCLIYSDLKNNRQIENHDTFYKRLSNFSETNANELKKMGRLKTTLQKNILNYLTCLKNPNIPMTNNQAERSLRHLVLKRKISFGSFTKRTADNLAILLSVLMSLKQRYQSSFFAEYVKV